MPRPRLPGVEHNPCGRLRWARQRRIITPRPSGYCTWCIDMSRLLIFLLSIPAHAQVISVCATGTCPGADNYTTLGAALNAMTASKKIIEVYAGQGDVTSVGQCGPDSRPGDYCTGGGVSAPNATELKYKPFCTVASPCIIRTNKYAKLPKDGQRITPDYADGSTPIVASFASNLQAAMATYKGAENCQVTLGGPSATGVTISDSGICHSCLAGGHGGAPSNNGGNAQLLSEDSTTGVHEEAYTFTSASGSTSMGLRVY